MTPFVTADMETLMAIKAGKLSPGESMRHYPELPSKIVLIERFGDRVLQFDVGPCHIYHFGTCYQSGQDISFNAVCLPENFNMQWQHKMWLSNAGEAPGMLYRFNLQAVEGGAVTYQLAANVSCEFPAVHPYRHVPEQPLRYTYLMAAAEGKALPFTTIVKSDANGPSTCWSTGGQVIGEPCFVPRLGYSSAQFGDEDDGWLIAQVYDHHTHTTNFVILDAQDVAGGPICTLKLGVYIPFPFHGTFAPEVFERPAVQASTQPAYVKSKL